MQNLSYGYDKFGNLASRKDNLSNLEETFLYYNMNRLTDIYMGNTEPLYFILKDHLGSWTTITDADGVVEQELSFDAWGNLRKPETWRTWSGVPEPMFDRSFTGHEHLYAFGLINMNGRMYDPFTSSFLSVDNYVQSPDYTQSFNRYAYCLNNPLKYTDPDGEFWHIVIGAAIGGIANLATNAKNCKGFWDYAAAFGVGAASGPVSLRQREWCSCLPVA